MREFNWPVTIYYEDTDAGGVVYYANYLKFFERARTEMLRRLGFEQDILNAEQNLIFVVRSVNVDYLKPVRFNDRIDVSAKVIEQKKMTLVFEQVITCRQEIVCKAVIRIACLDALSMKPKLIPFSILNQLTQ